MPAVGSEDYNKFVGRAINAAIVLGFGTFAITKLLSIDHDYWHVSFNYVQKMGSSFF